MFCIECGKELIYSAKFCSFCGTQQKPEKKKFINKKKIISKKIDYSYQHAKEVEIFVKKFFEIIFGIFCLGLIIFAISRFGTDPRNYFKICITGGVAFKIFDQNKKLSNFLFNYEEELKLFLKDAKKNEQN